MRVRILCSAVVVAMAGLAIPTLGAADEGRDLYIDFQCWQCHGYDGQGGAAERVASVDYPFAAFNRFVRFPNVMPAYPAELLSDADLRAIYDYLRAMDEPPPAEDIPALDDL